MDRMSVLDTMQSTVRRLSAFAETEDAARGIAEDLSQPLLDGNVASLGIRVIRKIDGKLVEFNATITAREVKEQS